MAISTYDWHRAQTYILLSNPDTTVQSGPAALALRNGGYFATWNDAVSGLDEIEGRVMDSHGFPIVSEFRVNTTSSNVQSGARIAQLANGNVVVAFNDFSADQ